MSMKTMNIAKSDSLHDRLGRFLLSLEEYKVGVLSKDILRLVGVEIYGFIKASDTLSREYEDRVHYFIKLVSDSTYASLEEKIALEIRTLREMILKMDKGRAFQEIKSTFTERAYINPLKNSFSSSCLPIQDLNTEEFLNALDCPELLYRLEDQQLLPHRANDQFIGVSEAHIRHQYKVIGEFFRGMVDLIGRGSYSNSLRLQEQMNSKMVDYQKTRISISENLHGRPLCLHVDAFRRFAHYAARSIERIETANIFQFYEKMGNLGSALLPEHIIKDAKIVVMDLQSCLAQSDHHDKAVARDPHRRPKTIYFQKEPCELYCNDTGEKYAFPKSLQRPAILIKAALDGSSALGDWLDNATDDIEDSFTGRDLYDVASHINRRFKAIFKLSEDLFDKNYGNKNVKINNKAAGFKIVQKRSR